MAFASILAACTGPAALISAIGVATDVTQRMEAEREIHRKAELEQLVARLSTHLLGLPAFDGYLAVRSAFSVEPSGLQLLEASELCVEIHRTLQHR